MSTSAGIHDSCGRGNGGIFDLESNGNAETARIAGAKAAEDEQRMRELNRLIAAGYGSTDPCDILDAKNGRARPATLPCAWHPFLAWW